MREIRVKNVLISTIGQEESENYTEFLKIIKERKINTLKLEAGNRVNIENGVFFDILWPSEDKIISKNAINNNSIVCKLQYMDFSMLFTGDIEEETEKALCELNNSKEVLNASVLKVPHHGSKSSSTEQFLEFVSPRIAVIGVGKNNNFGHPNEGVLQRLETVRNKNL